MSRLKFSVYGNCQNHPLSLILRCSTEFSSIYEELPIKSIHLLSPDEDEGVQETVRNLDLFIYQPVEANYRGNFRKLGTKFLLGYMKNDATAISIPVAYFTGYNPETIYLRDNNGGVVTGHFSDYHDLNILKAYHHGLDWQECISYIQMNEIYPLEFLKTILSNNLAELRKRESVIDIKVSDFIEKNWRQQRLFFSVNHCSNSLFLHEANQILHSLGLTALDPAILDGRPEYLGDTKLFIYPSVRKQMSLSFAEDVIQFANRTFTLNDTIKSYFNEYDSDPELVKNNIDFYSMSPDVTLSRIASYWTMPCAEKTTIYKLQTSLKEKDVEISRLHATLQEKEAQITKLQYEFDMIISTTTWRYVSLLHPIINKMLPLGTRRRQFVNQTLSATVNPALNLMRTVARKRAEHHRSAKLT